MKLLAIICFIFTYLPTSTVESNPFSQYQWKNRLLIIYTSESDNPAYEQQLKNLETQLAGYESRDLLVFKLNDQFVRQLPQENMTTINASEAIDFLSINDNADFIVSLVGKDGSIKKQQNYALSNQSLFAIIDAMPMRQNEMDRD